MATKTRSPSPSSTTLLLLVVFLQVSFCQDGNRQREHLKLLGTTANSELVDTDSCYVVASTFLNCTLKNSSRLTVDSNVSLDGVSFFICLCGSAWNVTYSFTDGTNITTLCSQCPFQLPRGDLMLYQDVHVFKERSNETNLGITVRLVHSGSSFTMFNGTVPLSQQEDTCGNNSKGPPEPSECGLTTTQPQTEPTTDPTTPVATTSRPPSRGGRRIHPAIIVAVVLAGVAIIVLVIVLLYALCRCLQRQERRPFPSLI